MARKPMPYRHEPRVRLEWIGREGSWVVCSPLPSDSDRTLDPRRVVVGDNSVEISLWHVFHPRELRLELAHQLLSDGHPDPSSHAVRLVAAAEDYVRRSIAEASLTSASLATRPGGAGIREHHPPAN